MSLIVKHVSIFMVDFNEHAQKLFQKNIGVKLVDQHIHYWLKNIIGITSSLRSNNYSVIFFFIVVIPVIDQFCNRDTS